MGFAAPVALAFTAASTVFGVKSNMDAAKAAEAEWSRNKRQNLIAAAYARERAADAISRGGTELAKLLGESEQLKASQRASFGGRNIEIGTGTARQITEATDLITSADALVIRENARRESQGHLIDAYSYEQGAQAPKPPGATSANIGTILGGASQFTGQLFNWRTRSKELAEIS